MSALPEAFVERMSQVLGAELPAFLEAMEGPYQRGIRMNPLKHTDAPVPGILSPVPWEIQTRSTSLSSR